MSHLNKTEAVSFVFFSSCSNCFITGTWLWVRIAIIHPFLVEKHLKLQINLCSKELLLFPVKCLNTQDQWDHQANLQGYVWMRINTKTVEQCGKSWNSSPKATDDTNIEVSAEAPAGMCQAGWLPGPVSLVTNSQDEGQAGIFSPFFPLIRLLSCCRNIPGHIAKLSQSVPVGITFITQHHCCILTFWEVFP